MAKVNILSVQRVSKNMADPLEKEIVSVVSRNTAQTLSPDDMIGDVQSGGYFKEDLDLNSVPLDASIQADDVVTQAQREENAGAMFIKQANSGGITPSNVMFSPRRIAELLEEFGENTDPSDFLAREGAEAYIKVFGTMTPDEARTNLEELALLAAQVKSKYDEDEYLVDADINAEKDTQEIEIVYGDPSFTPIVETVTSIRDYKGTASNDFRNGVQVIRSQRRIIEWADIYRIGNTLFNENNSVAELGWTWPFDFPLQKPEIGQNSVTRKKVPIDEEASKATKSGSSEIIEFNNLFTSDI